MREMIREATAGTPARGRRRVARAPLSAPGAPTAGRRARRRVSPRRVTMLAAAIRGRVDTTAAVLSPRFSDSRTFFASSPLLRLLLRASSTRVSCFKNQGRAPRSAGRRCAARLLAAFLAAAFASAAEDVATKEEDAVEEASEAVLAGRGCGGWRRRSRAPAGGRNGRRLGARRRRSCRAPRRTGGRAVIVALHANVTHDLGDLRARARDEGGARRGEEATPRSHARTWGRGWGRDGLGRGGGQGSRRSRGGRRARERGTYPRVLSAEPMALSELLSDSAPAAAAVRGEEHGIGRAHPDALVPAGAEASGRPSSSSPAMAKPTVLDRLRHRPSRVSRVRAGPGVPTASSGGEKQHLVLHAGPGGRETRARRSRRTSYLFLGLLFKGVT